MEETYKGRNCKATVNDKLFVKNYNLNYNLNWQEVSLHVKQGWAGV